MHLNSLPKVVWLLKTIDNLQRSSSGSTGFIFVEEQNLKLEHQCNTEYLLWNERRFQWHFEQTISSLKLNKIRPTKYLDESKLCRHCWLNIRALWHRFAIGVEPTIYVVIVNYGRSMLVKWSYRMTVCTLSDQKVLIFPVQLNLWQQGRGGRYRPSLKRAMISKLQLTQLSLNTVPKTATQWHQVTTRCSNEWEYSKAGTGLVRVCRPRVSAEPALH